MDAALDIVVADWLVLETAIVCSLTSFPLLISRWDELTPRLQMHGTWLALPLAFIPWFTLSLPRAVGLAP